MKSRFLSILFSIIILSCVGCKKSQSTVLAPIAAGPFSYGYFSVEDICFYFPTGALHKYYTLEAMIHSDSLSGNYSINGFLTLNNDTVLPNNNGYYYVGNLDTLNGYNWLFKAQRGNTVLSFHQDIDFPAYAGIIPDTIALVNGLSINISSVTTSDADSVGITFSEYSVPVKLFATSQGMLTLSSDELFQSIYRVSEHAQGWQQLNLSISKYDDEVINGKHYRFLKTKRLQKEVYIL